VKWAVVDTNVLVVAEGRQTHAAAPCRETSAQELLRIRDTRSLVLDTSWQILGEYQGSLTDCAGEPGPGQLFYNWAVSTGDHRSVNIASHPLRGFKAFPSDPRLETFDRDDRKFVAATIVSGKTRTRIVNAVDSDYSHHRKVLEEVGIVVQEICPDELT
jgi:hypothetical protein